MIQELILYVFIIKNINFFIKLICGRAAQLSSVSIFTYTRTIQVVTNCFFLQLFNQTLN